MDLVFLGTAASEGYPVPFCRCGNCVRARQLGGPNLRKRSAAIVDGLLLLDLGPDLFAASLAHGIPFTDVRYCLVTHEHADHFDATHLVSRSPLCQVEAPPLALYATAGALARVAAAVGPDAGSGEYDATIGSRLNLSGHALAPGETVPVGPYRVTAVPARHDPAIVPLLYVIERDGRSLFYATDTGPLPAAAWAVLDDWGGRFDVVALDHTMGLGPRDAGHHNADQFLETIGELRQRGRLAVGCRIFAHHIAHHGNPDHASLAALAAGRGYEVAYDGLAVAV